MQPWLKVGTTYYNPAHIIKVNLDDPADIGAIEPTPTVSIELAGSGPNGSPLTIKIRQGTPEADAVIAWIEGVSGSLEK